MRFILSNSLASSAACIPISAYQSIPSFLRGASSTHMAWRLQPPAMLAYQSEAPHVPSGWPCPPEAEPKSPPVTLCSLS